MSTPLTINPETVVIAAYGQRIVRPLSDYVRFDTLPTGIKVALNGGADGTQTVGRILQGIPGQQQVESIRFTNTTGAELTVVITTGTGTMTVSGVTELTGPIALPSGASTASKQDDIVNIINSLIGIAATSVLQAAGNASLLDAASYLATLAAPQTRTPRVKTLAGGGGGTAFTVTDGRYVSLTNTGTVDITIQISGMTPDYTLPSGYQLDWPLLQPRDTGYTMTIVMPASSTATIQYLT